MAIKDKDGNIYKLRGPNPLLKTQVEWDRSRILFHNFGWKGEVVHDERNPVEAAREKVIDIGEELDLKPNESPVAKYLKAKEFIDEVRKAPDPPKVEAKPEPPKVEERPTVATINVDQRAARLLKERGVEYYCVPVVDQKTHRDSLYDNAYVTPVYGDKFVFDAIIVDESDFQLQFWCVREIPKGSVIYQRAKEGEWERRWWRIERSEPKTGGFLVLSNISDVNPDFS